MREEAYPFLLSPRVHNKLQQWFFLVIKVEFQLLINSPKILVIRGYLKEAGQINICHLKPEWEAQVIRFLQAIFLYLILTIKIIHITIQPKIFRTKKTLNLQFSEAICILKVVLDWMGELLAAAIVWLKIQDWISQILKWKENKILRCLHTCQLIRWTLHI